MVFEYDVHDIADLKIAVSEGEAYSRLADVVCSRYQRRHITKVDPGLERHLYPLVEPMFHTSTPLSLLLSTHGVSRWLRPCAFVNVYCVMPGYLSSGPWWVRRCRPRRRICPLQPRTMSRARSCTGASRSAMRTMRTAETACSRSQCSSSSANSSSPSHARVSRSRTTERTRAATCRIIFAPAP